MIHKLRFNRVMWRVLLLLFSLVNSRVFAQNEVLTLDETAEYDIGYYCPIASTLNPSNTEIWILMNNCGGSRYRLDVFGLEDGSQVEMYNYQAELEALSRFSDEYSSYIVFDRTINPMVFTPDGNLHIKYFRYDEGDEGFSESTASGYSILIPIATGGDFVVEATPSLDDLLRGYSEYFEYAVYNHDHTQIAIWGGSSVHIIDVATETEVAELTVAGDEYTTFLWFSEDGLYLQALRVDSFDEPITSTLFIYSLADGALLQEYSIPAFDYALSPDSSLVAVNPAANDGTSSELFIMDLETGDISSSLSLFEPESPLTVCANTGNSMSDFDWRKSGKFFAPQLHWLPDNKTIVGSFAHDGTVSVGNCVFDYSRLRVYTINN